MKTLSILSCIMILVFVLSPMSFASTLPTVNSNLQEPVPEYYSDGTNIHITIYIILNRSDSAYPLLIEQKSVCPSSSAVLLRLNDDQSVGLYSNNAFTSNVVNTYNAISGEYVNGGDVGNAIMSYTYDSISYTNMARFRAGYFPKYYRDDPNVLGYYLIYPSQLSTTNTTSLYSNEFINWYIPHDNNVIRSTIPQPFSDLRHMYFADHVYLYQINIDHPVLYNTIGLYANNLTSSQFFDQLYIELSKFNTTTINLNIINRTEYDCHVYISKYDIVTGEYINTSDNLVSGINPSTGDPIIAHIAISVNDPISYGLWYSGFVNTDGLSNFDKLQISWSDTIDYSNDFIVIRNLLDQMLSSLYDISDNISDIQSFISDIYDLLDVNFNWFKTVYYNTILSKWDITKNQLDDILDALLGDGTETTYPPQESASSEIDNYVSEENVFITNFDIENSKIDEVFTEAISSFQENTNGFAFIKMLIETFVVNVPSSYIIVFISLTFGLVCLFLGKVISKS